MIRSLATSAIALIAGAAPVLADMTPAEAWESLIQNYTRYGYEVTTGNIEDTGNSLTVTDAVFSTQSEQARTNISIPKFVLSQTGDAKVRGVLEGDVKLTSTYQVPDEDAMKEAVDATIQKRLSNPAETTDEEGSTTMKMVDLEMTGTIAAPGNELLISGSAEDVLYEYNYPSVTLDMQVPLAQDAKATMPISAELTGLKGTQRNVQDNASEQSLDIAAETATISTDTTFPEDENGGSGSLKYQVTLNNLGSEGRGAMPAGEFDMSTQMADALAAGLQFDGTVLFDSMAASFNVQTTVKDGPEMRDQNINAEIKSGAGNLDFRIAEDGMNYAAKLMNSDASIENSNLPFPMNYAAEETSVDILFPVQKAEEAQPFKLAYALNGVTLGEEIWALFDPNNNLPRDPASLSMDVEGDAVVSENIFDPAFGQPKLDADGAFTEQDTPFEPKSLKINGISLEAIGAKADVTGEIDFAENPMDPTGQMDGTFVGVNALLENLGKTGLVPQDQLMGLRMMMGLFAKPVEGSEDTLETELVFKSGGQIFANGQRIK